MQDLHTVHCHPGPYLEKHEPATEKLKIIYNFATARVIQRSVASFKNGKNTNSAMLIKLKYKILL